MLAKTCARGNSKNEIRHRNREEDGQKRVNVKRYIVDMK